MNKSIDIDGGMRAAIRRHVEEAAQLVRQGKPVHLAAGMNGMLPSEFLRLADLLGI